MAIELTQNDLETRLRKSVCAISDLGIKSVDKIRLGSSCEEELRKLGLYAAFIEVLECFDVTDEDNNCVTEKQADKIFAILSDDLDICFPGKGFKPVTSGQNVFVNIPLGLNNGTNLLLNDGVTEVELNEKKKK